VRLFEALYYLQTNSLLPDCPLSPAWVMKWIMWCAKSSLLSTWVIMSCYVFDLGWPKNWQCQAKLWQKWKCLKSPNSLIIDTRLCSLSSAWVLNLKWIMWCANCLLLSTWVICHAMFLALADQKFCSIKPNCAAKVSARILSNVLCMGHKWIMWCANSSLLWTWGMSHCCQTVHCPLHES
jgi:hypothetical protein